MSRVHAVIEADHDGVTIHDNKSSNGTKKGSLTLKPHIRYNLENGDTIKLGDLVAVFELINRASNEESDVVEHG